MRYNYPRIEITDSSKENNVVLKFLELKDNYSIIKISNTQFLQILINAYLEKCKNEKI